LESFVYKRVSRQFEAERRIKEIMKKQFYYFILCLTILLLFSFSSKLEKPLKNVKNKNAESLCDSINGIYNVKDLDAVKFIELCVKNYDENKKLNFIVISGDFPENWVKKQDLEYLISKINSEQKCCGYMNVFSSWITTETAEVGGFATLFLKSYKEKKQINLGLNSNPKVDRKEAETIINWYKNQK
jgi:hypothetical protein